MPGRRQKTNNCLLSVLNLQRWGTSAILSEPSGNVGLTSANKTNLSGVLGGGGGSHITNVGTIPNIWTDPHLLLECILL